MPRGQPRQVASDTAARDTEKVPAGQLTHAVWPTDPTNVPAPQSAQTFAPLAEYWPGAQVTQVVEAAAPSTCEYSPALQSEQVVVPVAVLNEPAAQFAHSAAPSPA